MKGLDVFSTKFFEHKIDTSDAYNIINEILRKRDQIKLISSTSQRQSTEVYQTDYTDPVKLETFESIISKINAQFEKYNAIFTLREYWASIYKFEGHHPLHNHSFGLTDYANYSGILYLSSIGNTTFFSTSPTSFESSVDIQSEVGKIVLFPATLPHVYQPTFVESNERFVVAFNGNLINVY